MKNIRCKICSHDVRTIYDRQFKTDYYLCPNCEFLFIEDARLPSPEKEKAEYLSHNNTIDSPGYADMFRKFIAKAVTPFLPDLPPEEIRVLDFGSGPGDCVLSILLKEIGLDVDVYDVYFSPGKTYQGKQYHLVTCTEVVEHLGDPMAVFRLFSDLLLPGGTLALTTLFHPIAEEVPGGEEKFRDWWYRRDITHISFYRPNTLAFIAKLIGFRLTTADDRNMAVLSSLPNSR
ncbi:MAG: class I SAM-dependent methyltransferase [bacterium]|nr:class I SAM-dependent methyltransferase [bacterium]